MEVIKPIYSILLFFRFYHCERPGWLLEHWILHPYFIWKWFKEHKKVFCQNKESFAGKVKNEALLTPTPDSFDRHEMLCYITQCGKSNTRIRFTQTTIPLLWRHNGRSGVLNHQHRDCLFRRSFRHRSRKTSKLRVTGLCVGNSPVTSEFPAQMASEAENVSIW